MYLPLVVVLFVRFATALPAMQPLQLAPILEHDDPYMIADRVSTLIPNQYVVKLKDGAHFTRHSDFIDSLVSSIDGAILRHRFDFGDFQGYSVFLPNDNGLDAIRAHEDVEFIERNQRCHIDPVVISNISSVPTSKEHRDRTSSDRSTITQVDAPWHLARISQRSWPTTPDYVYPSKAGRGVNVYVIDSGVNVRHVEFEGRAKLGISYTDDGAGDDPNGHGTHVSGTVAAKTYGVAKKANIIGVQVLNRQGYGDWDDIIAGIQWSYKDAQKTKKPSVINLSLGGPRFKAVNFAINNAIAGGIHVLAAAGNAGADACRYSPASARRAFTVGSSNTVDQLSGFSNRGECVDIFAPGEAVLSTYIGGKDVLAYMSGTSMATPVVAGVASLLLSQKPQQTPNNLMRELIKIATRNTMKGLPKGNVNMIVYNGV